MGHWIEDRAEPFESPRMKAWFWVLAPGVVGTRIVGHVDASVVGWYTSRIDTLLRSGPVQTFHDWSELSSFDPEVRRPYRDWAERQDRHLHPPHFLVSSKILLMALAATKLVLRNELEVHRERHKFELALEGSLRGDHRAASTAPASSWPDRLRAPAADPWLNPPVRKRDS